MRVRAPTVVLAIIVATTLFAPFIGGVLPRIGIAHAGGCTTTCSFNTTSSIPINEAVVYVELDNNTGQIYPLPHVFQFANYTVHTITVLNQTLFGPSGARYVWKQWSIFNQRWTSNLMLRTPQILYNYTSVSWVATYDKQFQYTLTFQDAAGSPLNPVPTSVSLLPQGASSALTITSYASQWFSAQLYTVTAATWEGTYLTTTTTQTLDLRSASQTAAISLTAYPATIQIVNSNSNPVSGAAVTVTFANATSRSFQSDANGKVQLGDIPQGNFGATVQYQSQNYGPYTLTAINNPTNTLQVNGGNSIATSTTTAIVLLAIFGLAFFMILLAIKLRKTPGPPSI